MPLPPRRHARRVRLQPLLRAGPVKVAATRHADAGGQPPTAVAPLPAGRGGDDGDRHRCACSRRRRRRRAAATPWPLAPAGASPPWRVGATPPPPHPPPRPPATRRPPSSRRWPPPPARRRSDGRCHLGGEPGGDSAGTAASRPPLLGRGGATARCSPRGPGTLAAAGSCRRACPCSPQRAAPPATHRRLARRPGGGLHGGGASRGRAHPARPAEWAGRGERKERRAVGARAPGWMEPRRREERRREACSRGRGVRAAARAGWRDPTGGVCQGEGEHRLRGKSRQRPGILPGRGARKTSFSWTLDTDPARVHTPHVRRRPRRT